MVGVAVARRGHAGLGGVVSDKVQAVARVQITVEFAVDGLWGGDFSIEKIHEQAHEAAIDALRRGLSIQGLTVNSNNKTDAKIVGTPAVTAILVRS